MEESTATDKITPNDTNKDTPNDKATPTDKTSQKHKLQKVECPCGVSIARRTLHRHQRSKRHNEIMDALQRGNDNDTKENTLSNTEENTQYEDDTLSNTEENTQYEDDTLSNTDYESDTLSAIPEVDPESDEGEYLEFSYDDPYDDISPHALYEFFNVLHENSLQRRTKSIYNYLTGSNRIRPSRVDPVILEELESLLFEFYALNSHVEPERLREFVRLSIIS